MSLVGGLIAGGAIGLTHALESDHLAVVVTLVADDEPRSAAVVGASWGVGHAIPIVAIGLGFVALGVTLPPTATLAVEGLVGLVLVALGVRLLASVPSRLAVDAHRHGGGAHHHLALGDWALGFTHSHVHGEAALVGVLHGVVGSGALVIALVASLPPAAAFGLLSGFVLLSVATMAAVSLVWGRSLGTALERPIRVFAGLSGVGVGLLHLAEVLGVAPVA